MSMSQEEIEALMNGIEDDTPSQPEPAPFVEPEVAPIVEPEPAPIVEDIKTEESSEVLDNSNLDSLINELNVSSTPEQTNDIEADNSVLDNIEDESLKKLLEEPVSEPTPSKDDESIAKNWTEDKIEQGVFPFPVDKDTKVVNQLSQVANDQEEKASQIFDVLSNVLDNNDYLTKEVSSINQFLDKQTALLEMLNKKFPNVPQFNENLDLANSIKSNSKNILENIDKENMEIFEAMELMQFNDINRQKIERVMSVIRKLSSYLNNLFEDDNSHKEIVVAKHIAGDSETSSMDAEDLESLIDSYSKG